MRLEHKEKAQSIILACKLFNNTALTQFPPGNIIMQIFTDFADNRLMGIKIDPPTVSSVLVNEPDGIRDTISTIVYNESIEYNGTQTNVDPRFGAEDLIKRSIKTEEYSDSELAELRTALLKYLYALKKWAVSQPDLLTQIISHIQEKLNDLERDSKNQNEHIKTNQQAIGELREAERNAGWSKNRLMEQELSGDKAFDYYFPEDSSFKISDYFVLDNYKIVELNEYQPQLTPDTIKKGISINSLSDATKILSDQKVLLITGMYGTGKTAMIKSIFNELSANEKNNCYFFRAKDVTKWISSCITHNPAEVNETLDFNSDSLNRIFTTLSDSHKKTIVFIDELEEKNILLKYNFPNQ